MEKQTNSFFANTELEEIGRILSHDVRGSFHHITCFTDLIRDELAINNTVTVLEYLTHIEHSTHQLSNIISELVEYCRLGSNVDLKQKLDLNICFQQAIETLQDRINRKKAIIQIPNLPVIEGDKSLIQSVVRHILDNALKYAKPDIPPKIQICIEDNTDDIVLQFQDNGIGIPAAYHSQVFELMRRLHTDAEYSGLGIGLAACRRILGFHKGSILIDPDSKSGTTIIVNLPKNQTVE